MIYREKYRVLLALVKSYIKAKRDIAGVFGYTNENLERLRKAYNDLKAAVK